MQKLRNAAAVFLIALFLLPVKGANALDVPQLRGRVNDYAGILSASTQKQLDTVLAGLEQTDSTQIVVLTLPSLEGESLEAFSIRVAETWEIGQKGLDNGAILLVALKERKIRIEVGYGLEGNLTDLVAGRIIRNVIVPRFKTGNFDQGIADGVAAMIGVVRGEYEPPQTSRGSRDRPAGGIHSVFIPLLAFLFFINVLGRVRRGIGAAAGGILAPIVGGLFFNLGLLGTALLIPIGIVGGFFLGYLGGPLAFGHAIGRRGRSGGGIFWGGGGGFSSGGFGGFSGGGGGFGGGGASGGW